MSNEAAQQPLVVEEFTKGIEDYDAGTPPPDFSTWSYDKGRLFAARVKTGFRDDAGYKTHLANEAQATQPVDGEWIADIIDDAL